MIIFSIAFFLIPIIGFWKLFEKAGQPGWAAIVPIYNYITLLRVAGKPAWWILLYFIPVVNVVFYFLMLVGISERFGKDTLFTVLLLFFPFICFLILGFSDAEYKIKSIY